MKPFPFLVGRLKTGGRKVLKKHGKDMFPFLVGRLKTWFVSPICHIVSPMFPFLVGRLKTCCYAMGKDEWGKVSIPCR